MIVCPVCEHPQVQGDTCDVCGKRLVSAPPTSQEYPTLPELEQTAAAAVGNVAVALMPDLEVHHAPEVNVVDERMVELDPTTVQGVDAAASVPVQPTADVERTHFADDGQRTLLGMTVTCRYCGLNQPRTNRLCDKCANALPVLVAAAAAAPLRAQRCPSCGSSAEVGKACAACGYFIKSD